MKKTINILIAAVLLLSTTSTFAVLERNTAGSIFLHSQGVATVNGVIVSVNGNVGIGTMTPSAKLHVNDSGDASQGYIRASNFNPIPPALKPTFLQNGSYWVLYNATWVGWDDTAKAWKYYKEADNDYGITDPGNPNTWTVNGTTIGYFDGNLENVPPGTHCNNRYNPSMPAYRCNQDDIQVRAGRVWVDKYACRIIDVGASYSGTTLKDDGADMQDGGQTVSPYWMAFSQRAQCSTGMTWFIAQKTAMNAGKRLCSNAEWQGAASGTQQSVGNNQTNGSSWSSVAAIDVSRYGCIGMAGNVWEWVADWMQGNTSWAPSTGQSETATYGGDYSYGINKASSQSSSTYMPAALIRGGYTTYGAESGVFSLYGQNAPSIWYLGIGFRCAR